MSKGIQSAGVSWQDIGGESHLPGKVLGSSLSCQLFVSEVIIVKRLSLLSGLLLMLFFSAILYAGPLVERSNSILVPSVDHVIAFSMEGELRSRSPIEVANDVAIVFSKFNIYPEDSMVVAFFSIRLSGSAEIDGELFSSIMDVVSKSVGFGSARNSGYNPVYAAARGFRSGTHDQKEIYDEIEDRLLIVVEGRPESGYIVYRSMRHDCVSDLRRVEDRDFIDYRRDAIYSAVSSRSCVEFGREVGRDDEQDKKES